MSTEAAVRSSDADTRHRIVETAERYFREIGYQKTTVADIAKALRMSPANVYRFFDSKKAINEAVAERITAEMEAALEAIVERPAPAAERLRALIATGHHLTISRYTDHQRMHEMVEVAMTESWNVIDRHIDRVYAMFRELVAQGVESGEFDVPDIALAARCAHVALVRFFHPGLCSQCAQRPNPPVDVMSDFILAGLGWKRGRNAC
jgi:AcrR family transcriptional regulator